MTESTAERSQTLRIPLMQRLEYIKAGSRTLGILVILVGVTWMFLVLGSGSVIEAWPTWGIHFLVGASYWLIMAILSRLQLDAYVFHGSYAFGMVAAVLPLLDGGARLLLMEGLSVWPVMGTVLLGTALIVWKEVGYTVKGLSAAESANIASQRLQPEKALWDLAAPVHLYDSDQEEENRQGIRYWRVMSPFLPALGFALARNLPDSLHSLFSAYLLYFLVIMLAWNYARQLGLAIYLRRFSAR